MATEKAAKQGFGARFFHWYESYEGKNIVNIVYSAGASVVIIGALFKILHWPGASQVLMVGMFTEAFLFLIGTLEHPHPEFHWENVFPQLLEYGTKPELLEEKSHQPRPTLLGAGVSGGAPVAATGIAATGIAAPVAAEAGAKAPGLKDEDYKALKEGLNELAKTATQFAELGKVAQTGVKLNEKLAAAEWRMEQPHRYIYLPPLDSLAFFYSHGEDDIIAPLYEVLFDSAVVLDDTFVVASTAFNNEGSTYSRTVMGHTENIWLWDHPATRFYNIERWHNPEGIDSTDISWIKFRQLEWTGGVRCHDSVSSASYDSCGTWERHVMRCGCRTWAYPFFPIIELGFDTTLCHEVSNLRVAERGAGCATLMWDAGDGGPWVVAYGKITDAWEDFTFDTVTSPMLTLTGLEVGTQYFALVRGYCSVTGEYGEWTNPLEVEIYHPGSGSEPEGIDRPGDLGRFTRLMPNPAREQVSVLSSYKMSRIEVYALDGRKVLEQEVGGISTVAEVKDLPRGTYIMAVYLPHGVATKKLVLEK